MISGLIGDIMLIRNLKRRRVSRPRDELSLRVKIEEGKSRFLCYRGDKYKGYYCVLLSPIQEIGLSALSSNS